MWAWGIVEYVHLVSYGRVSATKPGWFLLGYAALFAFSGLCLVVSVLSVLLTVFCTVFSSVYRRGWHCIAFCAHVPLRIYSLYSLTQLCL